LVVVAVAAWVTAAVGVVAVVGMVAVVKVVVVALVVVVAVVWGIPRKRGWGLDRLYMAERSVG
jgi:hypothetical protein